MSEGPVVDDRSRRELLAELRSIAEGYTDEWDPTSEDAATTVLEAFSRFESEVIKRLNEVPEKHRVAFLDALGFDRRPPGTARLPLTVETAEDIDDNVVVPGGTQALAETDDAGSVIFEVPPDADFEATPSSLVDVYGVEPATDSIIDHGRQLDRGEPATLFRGTDRQRHGLYLGHGDLLNLNAGSSITVTVLTNAVGEVLEESLAWEYYGENDDGQEGWHPLEHEAEEVRELSDEDVTLRDMREALRERIREFTRGDPSEWGDNTFELDFRLPGPTTEGAVDGVESRWIRAVAAEPHPEELGIELESVALTVRRSADDGGIAPDDLIADDVPLSVDGEEDLRPFGRSPTPPSTLYVDSEEALTKTGATVSLSFSPPDDDEGGDEDGAESEDDDGDDEDGETRLTPSVDYGLLSGDPNISWEYWNGDGWSRLRLRRDGTDAFREAGSVSFVVPEDLTSTAVSGHEGYWIRARLISGNYGQPRYEITEEGTRGEMVEEPDPPVFGEVRINYDRGGEPFQHVVTDNNLTYRRVPPGVESGSFTPFFGSPDDVQTLYLGFDGPLRDGPIPLYVPVEDASYPRRFDPGMRWEYCTDPHRDTWEKLDVRDGTDGLTDRGIVRFSVPGETTSFERFGVRRHWIRVRAASDQFRGRSAPAGRAADADRLAGVATDGTGRERAREDGGAGSSRHVWGRSNGGAGRRRPRGDDPGGSNGADGPPAPPTVAGIYPNTQWADNARTITDERLGESDGSPGQTFECANAPVTDIEVWVDESTALSAAQRRRLASERPDDVRQDRDRFLVRWTEAGNFLESGKEDRHYVVDRTAGAIDFGDGQRGTIPPGEGAAVVATYRTGGGSDGNVDAGAVESLKTPIPLVDSVTNIEPGDGGADVESMADATRRGSEGLRTRGRAVSAADFEAVARAASRELAAAKCLPEVDDRGRRTPGWVTLLVVPRERRARPTPSVDLRERVRSAVGSRAPADLGGENADRIVVRGPQYAPVSVEASVSTSGTTSITTLKEMVASELDRFFHPLSGGVEGEGWAFGESPRPTAVATLVEGVESVESVDDLTVWVRTGGERIRVPAGRLPSLDEDAMICSGTHEVTVSMVDRADDRPRS